MAGHVEFALNFSKQGLIYYWMMWVIGINSALSKKVSPVLAELIIGTYSKSEK
jgi:hypothetical protein